MVLDTVTFVRFYVPKFDTLYSLVGLLVAEIVLRMMSRYDLNL